MTAPRPPFVEDFFIWPDRIVVNTSRFLDSPSQTDLRIKLWHVDNGTLVLNQLQGIGTTHANIGDLDLIEGAMYRVQVHTVNSDGVSAASKNAYARVPAEFGYTRLPVPEEPKVPSSGGTVPYNPTYVVTQDRRWPFTQWIMETGHVGRRPMITFDRQLVQFEWAGLTTAEKDILLTFLKARTDADPPEAFDTSTPELTGTAWFPQQGELISIQQRDLSWTVRTTCDEVTRDPAVFTVGESVIGDGSVIR